MLDKRNVNIVKVNSLDMITETLDNYIELYVLLVQEYISTMSRSEIYAKYNNDSIFFMGWKILNHTFKTTRDMKLKLKDTYDCSIKSMLFFIEYIDQLYSNSDEPSRIAFKNVLTCTNNKVFLENDYANTESNLLTTEMFLKLSKISEIVLCLNNPLFTLDQRLSMSNKFLQSYILLFTKDEAFQWCRLLEFIFEMGEKSFNLSFESHCSILNHFYVFVVNTKVNLDETRLHEIYLKKYYSDRETFTLMYSNMETESYIKGFLKWLLL
jgi:hypothetical protein